MKIELTQLRRAFDSMMEHLEESGESTVELDWDYYWDIPTNELYDPYKTPTNLDLGQLSEDWDKLRRVDSGEMPPIGSGMTWLASILRAVGNKVVG